MCEIYEESWTLIRMQQISEQMIKDWTKEVLLPTSHNIQAKDKV